MDAPPIRYAKSRDGLNIAYTDSGRGAALILMPFMWSNLQYMSWRGPMRPLFERLAQDYQVITFDARGEGCSTRGLKVSHAAADYLLDLEALVETLGLERFTLYGAVFFGQIALRYALAHPEQITALVLRNVRLDYDDERVFLLEMPTSNWDMFVDAVARSAFPGAPVSESARLVRESVTREDWLLIARSICESKIDLEATSLKMPTLLMADTSRPQRPDRDAMELASFIPGAQLVMYGGSSFLDPLSAPPSLLSTMLSFLANLPLPATAGDAEAPDGLSARELQVLQLVAAGKSNQEIADELVISRNTVRRHVSHIFGKTGVANRAQVVAYARDHGLM